MIKRLLSFLDASPVNFLAVKNIINELEQHGFQRLDAAEPIGSVKAGDKFFVSKNDSSVYAFQIGRKPLAEKGFHMICAHSDSPTFRIKPHAEMNCEGGIVKLNTEVYGGPIMSTWFDRPLTLAGRVIVKGDDVMQPKTLLLHIQRPLLQISNLAIHFNRQVNDGVKLSRQKDVLPILGIINSELEKGNLLMNVILEEVNKQQAVEREDILDFDLYLPDAIKLLHSNTVQTDLFQQQGKIVKFLRSAQPFHKLNLHLQSIDILIEIQKMGFHRYFPIIADGRPGADVRNAVVGFIFQSGCGNINAFRRKALFVCNF